MKVAVTGCNGSVGKPVVALALKRGLTIVGIDRTPPPSDAYTDSQFTFIQVDLTDYDKVLKVLEGCDGVIHLAAHRNPGDYKVETHNKCDSRILLDGNTKFLERPTVMLYFRGTSSVHARR